MKKYISLQQAAEIANVSRQTIANWVDERIIQSRKTRCSSGHKYEVHIDSLMNIINNSTIAADTQAITAYETQLNMKVAELSQQWKSLLLTKKAVCLYPQTQQIILRILEAVVNNNKELRGIDMIRYVLRGNNYEEVAKMFGLQRERVRQIINKTLLRSNKIFSWAEVSLENQTLHNTINDLQQEVKQLKAENYNLRRDKEDLLINNKINENIKSETFTDEQLELLATSINDTTLPGRIKKLLFYARIYTVRDLLHKDKLELLRGRCFGYKALITIEDWLEAHNLTIGQLKRKY